MLDLAGGLFKQVKDLDAETSIVQRSAAIAVENVKQHIGSLRPRYEESKAWADNVRQDQAFLLDHWGKSLENLSRIPAIHEVGRCLYRGNEVFGVLKPGRDTKITLYDFVHAKDLGSVSKTAKDISDRFIACVGELHDSFEDVAYDSFDVVDNFGQAMSLSDIDLGDQAERLIEEVGVVARKVNADYDHVLDLPNAPKSISDMSRTALLHTRNFLPALQQTVAELDHLLRHGVERKNQITISATKYLQRVSQIESNIAQVHSQLANLDVGDDETKSFDTLNHVVKLPLTYGMLLVEFVRRREWTEKITTDSSSLVEEFAIYRDEEAKRRKKWAKDLGDAVDLATIDDMVLGVDINLQAQKQNWSMVSRQDLRELLKVLKTMEEFGDVIQAIESGLKVLDAPTKQQARRAKAFKNGSIHDATPGKQSLLLRGDDEYLQSLQNDKSRLEDRLKSSESRIRKLEDLLHKQTQTSRPPSSHVFNGNDVQGLHRNISSPAQNFATVNRQGSLSRRSSISTRRITQDSEDQSLAQRIVDLEAELAIFRQNAEAKGKSEADLKNKVQEAVSTKEDLLNNMEAQQREFDDERRLVEEDNRKLKIKLEEMEDEMDRMLESREHDHRVFVLEEELEKDRKKAAVEVQNAQRQVEDYRKENMEQVKKAETLQRQIQDQDEEIAELSTRLQKRDMSAATNHRALRTVMFRLSKDSIAPEDLDSLVETVEELVKQSAAHLAEVEKTLETIRADNEILEIRVSSQEDEISDLKEKLGSAEMEVFSLREDLADRKRTLATVRTELEAERHEHSQLRSRFADGEANSESLRMLVAEKEEGIATLSSIIAGLESDIQELQSSKQQARDEDREIRLALESNLSNQESDHKRVRQDLESQVGDWHAKWEELQNVHLALNEAFQSRARRAEEVSSRLYELKNSLGRLLEQVGFTVSKEGDKMVFQRTTKATSASAILSEPSSILRSVSAPLLIQSAFDIPNDKNLPRWPVSNDAEAETQQFAAFMRDIESFEPSQFIEAITKRIRDIDHTARKCFKDARGYRDKYKRAQSEAHEKITVRAFKEGDLALFLPTRNQATKPWAAFNVGFPHYFLREQDSHKLPGRDWLLARINKIESRVVDLSKSMNSRGDGASEVAVSFDDENPFELSDGLRWNLVDATEEKLGPPMTIGSSKTTVASANVDATGSIRMKKSKDGNGATVTLTRSLDSRRSSSNSKAGVSVTTPRPTTATGLEDRLQEDKVTSAEAGVAELSQPAPSTQVRTDLLFGP